MTNRIGLNEISELQQIAKQTISAESDSMEISQPMRSLLDTMRQEATEYGFTDADVVRALLRPALKVTKGCNCHTCKARRGELAQAVMASDEKA